jgi:hypothetical protein
MIHRADVLGRITADFKAQAPDQIAVSKCRIASIDPNHAMILPHDAEHARRMGWMCDRAFETGFRRTRFDRSGNDARGFTPRFAAQAHLQLILLPHGSREIAALLPASTVRAFGGAPPPTMPSADFCATIRSPCDDLSPEGHGADLPR